jgi:glycosyltransferase involved in cell wall biosynthesis
MLEVLGMPPYGGARTAAMGWVTALARFSPTDQFFALVNQREPDLDPFQNVEQIIISARGRLWSRIYLQLCLPGLVKKYKIDIVHFMRNLAVIVPSARVIVNINDLTRLIFPDMFSRWDILYWQVVQARVLRQTQRIICISNQTRLDVSRWLDYPAGNVITIFPGLKAFGPSSSHDASESIRAKYSIPEKFILYVGGLAKHKNIRTLVKAFAELKQSTSLPQALVIVGGQYHTHNDTEVRDIARQLLGNQVMFTGTVAEDELALLYSAAEAFVFPSMYEGFGLAPLEAMACGTPVIASRVGSLPEVLDQAALWVDAPLDEQAFATAIINLLQDTSLQNQLSKKGLDQAAKFSWAKTAAQTMEVYQSLISKTPKS